MRAVRLEAKQLKRVVGARVLFEDLSFAVEPGESLAICGTSGSGKTQLLRVLANLEPADKGVVTLDGRGPSLMGPTQWRRRVCYVAQRPPSFEQSARQLVAILRDLEAQRGRDWDDWESLLRAWEMNDESLGRPLKDLSGGEQQRVWLALAVCQKPDVLLLDEPTSALDAHTERRVEEALRGKTSVWVTHDDAQRARVTQRTVELL